MSDFPMFVYIYHEDGTHDKPFKIKDENVLAEAFVNSIRLAILKKLEVRITDPDDFLIFHSQNGECIFPKEMINYVNCCRGIK